MIIDVSVHQGIIDWNTVKSDPQNIEGVIIKATEGVGFRDKQLSYNATEAKKVGLKIGYYHFASLNDSNEVKDAQAEAAAFLKAIEDLPKADYPLILDIETNKIKLSPVEVETYINTFFKALGNRSYALYSYTPFLDQNLPKTHKFGSIPLWIAAYTPKLKLPKGWVKPWLWQYSCTGKVKGIKGNVDLNK